jgi:hypothetical protein
VSICPESAKRAAMTDAEFWEYVLTGPSGERIEDVDEPDPNEPWDSGLETSSPCPECGERGACSYDTEGRALIHAIRGEDLREDR